MTDDEMVKALAVALVGGPHVGHPVARHESPLQYDSLSGDDCDMPRCRAEVILAALQAKGLALVPTETAEMGEAVLRLIGSFGDRCQVSIHPVDFKDGTEWVAISQRTRYEGKNRRYDRKTGEGRTIREAVDRAIVPVSQEEFDYVKGRVDAALRGPQA